MQVQSVGQEDSLVGAYGNLLRYSFLENPMDIGSWQATVYRVTKRQTRLRRLSMHKMKDRRRLKE